MFFGIYRNAALNAVLGSGSPATVYCGISIVTTDDEGNGFTEPVAAEYARVAITNSRTYFPEAADGVMSNAYKIEFPLVVTAWGTAYEFAFFTGASNDPTPANMVVLGSMNSPKVLEVDKRPTFLPGELEVYADPTVI